ncbi:hypothetical protein SDC9_183870 [bioreactor metagenome]|uniref:Uncharacterized protein n=1 Tax=bioreactor metagenome TaxID=1076179 RepID=A0A645HBE2_9ZZZZ
MNHKDPTGYKKIVVKTWIVASMLDAILFMATSGGSLSFSAVGLALKKLATGKSTKKLAEKLLFGKVVPVFIRGYKNIFLTAVRKVIKRATGVAVVGLNIRLVDVALGRLKRYNIGNIAGMFLSWGSFASGVLDLSDGKLDGKITIKT